MLPRAFGELNARLRTPVPAIVVTVAIGAVATLSGKTDALITMSVLGALGVYLVSMASMIRLRRSEPSLERPYRAPGYPVAPVVAMVLAAVSLVAVAVGAPWVFGAYVGVMAVGAVVFRATRRA
jgi:ethanolamine permease